LSEPGRVVDGDVHELPADPAHLPAPVAVDAMAGPADPAQLLDMVQAVSDRPSTSTRSASSRFERGHVLALLRNVTVRPPLSR